jgi:alpha-D-ribose 1-methylphosphonate 5-triphosphate diphosphatase PhnM
MMDRQISQRQYDAQERYIERLNTATVIYRRDMKELARLAKKYPAETKRAAKAKRQG